MEVLHALGCDLAKTEREDDRMKIAGFGLLGIGLVLLAVGLLADVFGIGGHDGFGRNQVILAVAGAVAAVLGGVASLRTSNAA